MKKKQVTLLELAKRLNLSPSTVSRALNNRHRISEETRKRVKALAEELEYQPNPSAKNLRESRTYTLGVLIPRIANNFFSRAISGIEEVAIEAGYNIIICQSHESAQRERVVAEMLLANRVDGVLFSPSHETVEFQHFRSFLRKDIPIVFFDRFSTEFEASRVVVNDYEGAFNGVKHLIESGCKNIAHLAGPEILSNTKERVRGYCDALKTFGHTVDEGKIYYCELNEESTSSQANALLDAYTDLDAIFCFNDPIAYYILPILKSRNIKIPDDISIVGFGNEPHGHLVEPSLTTVAQPAMELGRVSTRLMIDQLDAEKEGREVDFQTITLQTALIVRNSTKKS